MSKRDLIAHIKTRMGVAPAWHKDVKKLLKKLFPNRKIYRSSAFPDEIIIYFETTITQSDTDKITNLFKYEVDHDYISILGVKSI
jgi:hypothetical protein